MNSKGRVAILVHGTGATALNSSGPRWWQDGGALWQKLAALGPEMLVEAFIWTGVNSEFERRAAGRRLAERIAVLHTHGYELHLVGHSHGGSVIWHALELLARTRGTALLDAVRSVTVVGTPFLHYGPRTGKIAIRVSLVVASFASIACAWLATAGGDVRFAWRDEPVALTVWAICGLIALACLLKNACALFALIRHYREAQGQHPRFSSKEFRAGFLALWSRQDEPIIGLGASTSLTVSRLGGKWEEDGASKPLLDRFRILKSATNELTNSFVSRLLQGSDIDGLELRGVNPWPIAALAHRPIPEVVDQRLITEADGKAASLGTRVRSILVAGRDPVSGFAHLQDAAANEVTFRELVHTTYFDQASCVELIAAHIRLTALVNTGEISQEFSAWYKERYSTLSGVERTGNGGPANSYGAVALVTVALSCLLLGTTTHFSRSQGELAFGPTTASYWVRKLADAETFGRLVVIHKGGVGATSFGAELRAMLQNTKAPSKAGQTYDSLEAFVGAFAAARSPSLLEELVGRLSSPQLTEDFLLVGLPMLIKHLDDRGVDDFLSRRVFATQLTRLEDKLSKATREARSSEERALLGRINDTGLPIHQAVKAIAQGLARRGMIDGRRWPLLIGYCGESAECVDALKILVACELVASGHDTAARSVLPLPAVESIIQAETAGDGEKNSRKNAALLRIGFRNSLVTSCPHESGVARLLEWSIGEGQWEFAAALVGPRPILDWDQIRTPILSAAKTASDDALRARQILSIVAEGEFVPSPSAHEIQELQRLLPHLAPDAVVYSEPTGERLERLRRRAQCQPAANSLNDACYGELMTTPRNRVRERYEVWKKETIETTEWRGENGDGLLYRLAMRPKSAEAEKPDSQLVAAFFGAAVSEMCNGVGLLKHGFLIKSDRDAELFSMALSALGAPPSELPESGIQLVRSIVGNRPICAGQTAEPDDVPQWLFGPIRLPLANWLWNSHRTVARSILTSVPHTGLDRREREELLDFLSARWESSWVLRVSESDRVETAVFRREALLQLAICLDSRSDPIAEELAKLALSVGSELRGVALSRELRRSATLEALWHARKGDWRSAATSCQECDSEAKGYFMAHVFPVIVAGIPPRETPERAECGDALSADRQALINWLRDVSAVR